MKTTFASGAVLFLLTALAAPAQDSRPDSRIDFDAEYERLVEEARVAEEEFYRPFREAKSDEERRKIPFDFSRNPVQGFVPKLRDLATRARGTPAGLRATLWVLHQDPKPSKAEGEAMLKDVVEAYLDRPELEQLADALSWRGRALPQAAVDATLKTLAEKSPHASVRAAAWFAVAARLGVGKPTEASKAERRAILDRLVKEYGATAAGARAQGEIFEVERLQIGMVAPDHEAVDQHGVAWKLSDYRGKVVVVDFWGYW
ncbi:MAG TPA: hypothetical protein VEI02_04995 [Planctomycetota bacterium]|nr:hypothetical protein [Planctomycetota bacterium]